MAKEISEEHKRLLKQVVEHFDKEDRSVRERQVRTRRQLKLFWEGIQRTYFSEVAHDWRIWDPSQETDSDQAYYDKPVNIFRAYLESIIAALSVTVPPIKCYPDDADNSLDILTAKAGDKIASLIYRHNDAPLLWINALYTWYTEGLLACYSYTKSDEKYGTIEKENYEEYEEEHEYTLCSICGYEIEDKTLTNNLKDEFKPEHQISQELDICPNCEAMMVPEVMQKPIIATRRVGKTTEPKTRICMEIYGGLFVKIPISARKQADCPYLILSYETNVVNVIERFPDLRNKLKTGDNSSNANDDYEAWARMSPQYLGETPEDNITVRETWVRPCGFNVLKEEECEELKKEYPNGVKVVLANDEFAEACPDSLDDCWTIAHNPLGDYLQQDPPALVLTAIQEITNDLISLTLQTIEHGIPQTFADPGVLNFAAYSQKEVLPGDIQAATPRAGKTVADGFYEVKTASLSAEVLPFATQIQQLGQLVSGALPSLFGGQMTESRTASEYSMSRAQALQRLQNTWKMLTAWWKNIYGKAIPAYIKEVQHDERDVQRDTFGNFINVFIRRAELEGRIGRIELEANENLPITWNQKKDIIMQLLMSGNPEILQTLGSPENLPLIREAIGITEFYVPGEDDRNKQYAEIKQLMASEPIMMPPDPMMLQQVAIQDPMMLEQASQPQEMPSVPIDPDIDNHVIEFEICRKWLVSDTGQLAKIENQMGYQNVLLHAKQHLQIIQMQQMQQAQQGAAPNPSEKEDTGAPIKEERNVRAEF